MKQILTKPLNFVTKKFANYSSELLYTLEQLTVARENLKSGKGITLRKQRGEKIKSCFGNIKHNMGFRRFHVGCLQKIKAERTIIAMAHNLRKNHLQKLEMQPEKKEKTQYEKIKWLF